MPTDLNRNARNLPEDSDHLIQDLFAFGRNDIFADFEFDNLARDSRIELRLKISRLLGLGLGLGIENFAPVNSKMATYPVFAEARGYFLPGNISPFYTLAAGWGFVDKKGGQSGFDRFAEEWHGGWMAQGQIGYRIGNHFTVHVGLRFQREKHTWQGGGFVQGVDRIRQRRFDMGVGILL